MPAFSNFTEGHLGDLAHLLHMQVELVANRGTYKRLNVITRNAAGGEAYLNGKGGCKNCHSPRRRLAKIGTKKVTVTLPSGRSIRAR